MLSEHQITELNRPLLKEAVSQRAGSFGKQLDYLESWYVIETANEIFGFDGWEMAVISLDTVWRGERSTQNGPKAAISAMATVRIKAAGVVREDTGYGDAMDSDEGKAYELAHKEAVSDAMKRCFRTFGERFGNGLYSKGQRPAVDNTGKSFDECNRLGVRMTASMAKKEFGSTIADKLNMAAQASDKDGLDAVWESILDEYGDTLPTSWVSALEDKYQALRENMA